MTKRRTGNPSLAYMGVEASTPPQLVMHDRAPTVSDYAQYNIGHIWIEDATPQVVWMLTNKDAHLSTWLNLSSGGAVGTITQILGGDNINIDNGVGPVATVNLDESIFQPVTSADGLQGLYALGGVDFLHNYGTHNTFLGGSAGNRTLTILSATENTGVGYQVLSSLTSGELNVAVGDSSLGNVTTGERNTAIGHDVADSLTIGDGNSALGSDSLGQLVSGDYNLSLGMRSGFSYTGAESNNILIGNEGTLAESNVIHIGTQGVGDRQQDTCFIAGVYQSVVGATNEIMFVDDDGQLGSSTGNNGELLIGATGASPAWANLLSSDGSVIINNGVNSIDLTVGGAPGGGATTFNTDVAGPAVVLGNVINILGDGGVIQTDGTVANTVTVEFVDGGNAGDLLIAGGGAGSAWATLTSTGGSITVTPGVNTLNIEAVGAGGGANTFHTDSGDGIAVAGTINVYGGLNINTEGAGQDVTINLDESIFQPITNAAGTEGLYALGGLDFLHNYGTNNTFTGESAGNRTLTVLSATDNTGFGSYSLDSLTTGSANSFLGSDAGRDITTGTDDSGVGYECLANITSAYYNTGLGSQVFNGITTGSNNIGLGFMAGSSCTVNDSDNILIGHIGSPGLDNTIRIGTDGVGAGQQDACYIAGVYGAALGATNYPVFVDNTGKVGVANGANGEVLIGGGAGPEWASLASADGSITITTGVNTIDLSAPAGDVTTVNGGSNITTVNPGGPVVTVNLDNDVTITGDFQAAGGTFTDLGRGVVQADAVGELFSSEGSNGQILISSSVGPVSWVNITEGTGITVTNAANSITISSTSLAINDQVGTTYTLVSDDAGKEVKCTNVAAITLTVLPNASVAFPIGTQIILVQGGAGALTVAAGGGVTVNSAGGRLTMFEQYSAAALIKQAVNSWLLAGDIR